MIDTLRSIQAGITAAALFLFMIAFVALLAFAAAPVIGEAWRKWRKRGKLDKVVSLVAVGIAIAYGGSKPHVVPNAGADDGIALVCIEAEYDSTNDVTAVNVKFTTGDVTTATPVLVRNAESEQWRELFKVDATVTPGQTNVLAFAVAGNAATNRYWWVGVDTPAVIIESQGITITNFVATSKSVRIDWTCDDPKATVFAIQRRRKKPTGIPYDAEVEYLESTGTQWIDTGISPYGRTPIARVDFALQNQVGVAGVFGTWASNNRRLQIFKGVNYTGSLGIGTYENYTFSRYIRYDVTLNGDSKTALVNGSTISGFNTDNGFGDYNLYLFWRNNNNGDGTKPAIMRCYACQIWDGNTLVRDFIPVRKGTVGYMYDRVSGQLFGNAGTGAFEYGSDTLSDDWETVDTTTSNSIQYEGFTVGEDWEWRIMSTYTEGDE